MSWVTHFPCNRHSAERLTEEQDALAEYSPAPAIVANEEDEQADRWRVDVYTEDKPQDGLLHQIAAILGLGDNSSIPVAERVDDADWVTVSQSGLSPVEAGRFFVHTPQHPPSDQPGLVNLCIDAGRAFGTGHHATTTGCLLALERLYRRGQRFTAVADIGSGTGLLAFAALNLWPKSWALATDIDPVSVETIIQNAAVNGIPIGEQAGAVLAVVADGTRHPLIAAAAPYDLVIANILAGPLITLAPALADITAPGGTLILAGLLDRQAQAVRSAYQRYGFRVDRVAAQPDEHADSGGGSWHILTLTKRVRYGYPRTRAVTDGRGGLPPGDFGSW